MWATFINIHVFGFKRTPLFRLKVFTKGINFLANSIFVVLYEFGDIRKTGQIYNLRKMGYVLNLFWLWQVNKLQISVWISFGSLLAIFTGLKMYWNNDYFITFKYNITQALMPNRFWMETQHLLLFWVRFLRNIWKDNLTEMNIWWLSVFFEQLDLFNMAAKINYLYLKLYLFSIKLCAVFKYTIYLRNITKRLVNFNTILHTCFRSLSHVKVMKRICSLYCMAIHKTTTPNSHFFLNGLDCLKKSIGSQYKGSYLVIPIRNKFYQIVRNMCNMFPNVKALYQPYTWKRCLDLER